MAAQHPAVLGLGVLWTGGRLSWILLRPLALSMCLGHSLQQLNEACFSPAWPRGPEPQADLSIKGGPSAHWWPRGTPSLLPHASTQPPRGSRAPRPSLENSCTSGRKFITSCNTISPPDCCRKGQACEIVNHGARAAVSPEPGGEVNYSRGPRQATAPSSHPARGPSPLHGAGIRAQGAPRPSLPGPPCLPPWSPVGEQLSGNLPGEGSGWGSAL